MALIIRFLHILTAFWFIAGLLGRTVAMWQASKEKENISIVQSLVLLAGQFERFMVIPGSLFVIGFGLITAWLMRLPIFGSLQGTSSNWLLVSTVLSISMIPVVKFVFIPRGKLFESALEQAITEGKPTKELEAAFADKTVRLAHYYEIASTFAVLALMVMKPF